MKQTNDRTHSENVLSTVAIALIAFSMCTYRLYPFYDYASVETVNPLVFLFRTLLLTFSYMGLPFGLFLMGGRLLKRDYETPEDVTSFYKGVLCKFLLAIESFIVLTGIYNALFDRSNPVTVSDLLKQLLFLERPRNMPQVWMLYVILSLILAAPFVSIVVKRFTFKALALPFSFAVITGMILPWLGQVGIVYWNKTSALSVGLPLNASGGYLCAYFVLGYYFQHKRELRDFPIFLLSLIFLLGFVPNLFLQTRALDFGGFISMEYSSPLLLLSALAAYEIIRRISERPVGEKAAKVFLTLSRLSTGVLLIHGLVMMFLNGLLSKIDLRYPIKLVILYAATLAVSYGLTFLIGKLGKVGKVILCTE